MTEIPFKDRFEIEFAKSLTHRENAKKLYVVSRTDEVDWNECSRAIVRAASEAEALALVLGSGVPKGYPLQGFESDGNNAKVELLETSGESEIIMTSESGA